LLFGLSGNTLNQWGRENGNWQARAAPTLDLFVNGRGDVGGSAGAPGFAPDEQTNPLRRTSSWLRHRPSPKRRRKARAAAQQTLASVACGRSII
jgi:hypothetical protein